MSEQIQTDVSPESLSKFLRSRRVSRTYSETAVTDDEIRRIIDAARWATSAGNRHIHKFLVVRDPDMIRRVRTVAPGMLGTPPCLIIILTDAHEAKRQSVRLEVDSANYMDVGTSAMNMMIMAHAMEMGTCPVTSFSQSGTSIMLRLPDYLTPEWILMLGHPASTAPVRSKNAPKAVTAEELTIWDVSEL